jgi:cellulose synthase/poly-beta-1,6-N-acetylglucosamine synthase-like glycosyltransferase
MFLIELVGMVFFALATVLIVYVYVGYPLVLYVLSKLKSPTHLYDETYTPLVSLIIAAYNEEQSIKRKLDNSLQLDYPEDKLEIMVGSDASTDSTDDIVKAYGKRGIILNRVDGRLGKTEVQNQTARMAKGEVLVFSDATTNYEPHVIRKLVRNFVDPSIGCVAAELVYVNKQNTSVGHGGGLYWKYEKWLKRLESKVCSLIGVSGCCYAVRKAIYPEIDSSLISDFVIAQFIYGVGYRVIHEPEAICYEESNYTTKDEFRMRTRVIIRTLNALYHNKDVLNPFKHSRYAVQLLSHKILRYLVPWFMIVLFLSNLLLIHIWFFQVLLLAQIAFYALSSLGYVLQEKFTKTGILLVPYYFCLVNISAFIATIKFCKGEKETVWEPIRSSTHT